MGKKIGEGAHSVVYECTKISEECSGNLKYAVKITRTEDEEIIN